MAIEDSNSNADGSVDITADVAGDDKITMTRREFDAHNAKLRRSVQGKEDRKAAAPRDDSGQFESKEDRQSRKAQATADLVARTVAETIKGLGLAPSEEPRRSVAAAPNAPSKVDDMGGAAWNGLTNVFALSAAQLEQLGPIGLRNEFEKLIQVGRSQMGAPQRPVPGKTARR